MRTTRDVLENHLKSFFAFDLEGVLADYAPGAVFFTADGPLVGVEQIRPMFKALIAEFAAPGAEFRMRRQFVDGDYGYILWDAQTAERTFELATDTFVVRNGNIVAQSFTSKALSRARTPA
jgi:ketosteroid isomerase-like protein